MRMVDPDTTVHLVRVIPFDQQTGGWYTIENHGIETGECLLEPFLAQHHNRRVCLHAGLKCQPGCFGVRRQRHRSPPVSWMSV